MALGSENPWSINFVQWMIRREEQEHVFGGLSKEKAFHAVNHLASLDIPQTSPATLGPASPFEVAEYHLANMEIPWILSGSVDVVSGLDKFWPAAIPGKTAVDVSRSHIPSFRETREARPNGGSQQVNLNRFINLAVQC
jgi:hypothetical protein